MAGLHRARICRGIILLIFAGLVPVFAEPEDVRLDVKPAKAGTVAVPTPAEQFALLEKHKPILYLQKGEDWPPVRVNQFLRDAQLEKQIENDRWTAIRRWNLPANKEGCRFTPCFRLNLPCDLKNRGATCFKEGAPPSDWRNAVVYGTFVEVRHPLRLRGLSERPAYLLRYSYFYYFDDWRSSGRLLWQVHDADWEAVTVGLSATRTPLFAAYSQHCSGAWREWKGNGILKDGNRPRVYVALGSHAHYFNAVDRPAYLFRCKYSQNAAGELLRWLKGYGKGDRLFDQVDQPKRRPTATTLVPLSGNLPQWTDFLGVWSEGEYVYVGPRPRRFTRWRYGDGPKTPPFLSDRQKDFWHETSS